MVPVNPHDTIDTPNGSKGHGGYNGFMRSKWVSRGYSEPSLYKMDPRRYIIHIDTIFFSPRIYKI